MAHFDLRQFTSAEQLAQTASWDWLQEVSKNNNRPFCTALSGGRIARVFCSSLATQVIARRIPLSGVHFFWSDERCVSPTDPDSNYRIAQELLFAPLSIPADQIHRVPGEISSEAVALAAQVDLSKLAPPGADDQPVLDLVLLGMGEDGHVASLFPGEPEAVMASRAVYRCVRAVKPPPLRITLGYPAIAAARQVWVLASGAGKELALRESLDPQASTPLARVLRLRANTRIYSDIVVRA